MCVNRTTLLIFLVGLMALTACSPEPNSVAAGNGAEPRTGNAVEAQFSAEMNASAELNALADELFEKTKADTPYVRMLLGLPITNLGDISLAEAERGAAEASAALARLEQIPGDDLSTDEWVFKGMLRHSLIDTINAPKYYWLTFRITPYLGGFALGGALRIFATRPLTSDDEREDYLSLVSQYADRVREIRGITLAQAERGILLPKPATQGALNMLNGTKTGAATALKAVEERLGDADAMEFKDSLDRLVDEKVVPAFDALIAVVDEAYIARAPESVGVGQYPGGKEYYLDQIRAHTGLALTPEEIHQRGLIAIEELNARKAAVRDALGFAGSREEFNDQLRKDPRFIAKSPQEVEDRFMAYISQIEPVLRDYFSVMPKAKYGVKRLDPRDEPGQTYGFYQQPSPAEPKGLYRYNGSQLDQRNMAFAQHLIYHELLPGHHFHLALQTENTNVHAMRAFMSYGAFTEGWAEYAASLGEEMGMYEPYDMYGHLTGQSFLASRLVVDTGMNYFGWTLEQARQFMRDNTFESDVQVETETLRYSTDMPGQALGYRLGFETIWALRRKAEAALGENFDIKAFHAVVVGNGGMPLNVLQERVDKMITGQ